MAKVWKRYGPLPIQRTLAVVLSTLIFAILATTACLNSERESAPDIEESGTAERSASRPTLRPTLTPTPKPTPAAQKAAGPEAVPTPAPEPTVAPTEEAEAGEYSELSRNIVVQLTDDPATDRSPSWSPDGLRIAFYSYRDGDGEIYVMNADGGGVVQLTDNDAEDSFPSWSPDGSRIAFVSDRDGDFGIYVMNADGGSVVQLTVNIAWHSRPSWSPDGRRIAFHSGRDYDDNDIYVMNADGSGVVQLTDDDAGDFDPSWSPDGRRIAFYSGRAQIYVMNADGGGGVQLTDDDAEAYTPSWSPDGRRIAFMSRRDGDVEIYVMNADGSGVVQLTDDDAADGFPSWSPDGRRIAFQSNRDGDWDIYVMNVDGNGDLVRVPTATPVPPTATPVRDDHSDEARGATPIRAGQTLDGEIETDSDTDVFRFDAREGYHYTIEVVHRSIRDTVMIVDMVLDGDRWEIEATDYDSGSESGKRVRRTATSSGTFHFYVYGAATGTYRVRLQEEPVVDDVGGSGIVQLTDHAYSKGIFPSWSPDGRRIAFESSRDGDWDIYVMNADGKDIMQITDDDAWDTSPSWSPDGRRIAFVSRRDGDFDIYVMNADGSGVVQLTDDDAGDGGPSWSPDGRRIAFTSDRDGDRDIYVMNADGSDVVQLTDGSSDNWVGSWSPDGRRIAFTSNRDGDNEIYVMNADGSGIVQLTDDDARDAGPSWSPDGHRIAFQSDRYGDADIYVMNADGSGVVLLTDDDAGDGAPSWSPDGHRIAFQSDRDGRWEIYVMNAATQVREAKEPIVFADLNWDSVEIQTRIAGFIIEHGYGYPVKKTVTDTAGQFPAFESDAIDISMEVWKRHTRGRYESAIAAGHVSDVGSSLDDSWQAFVVPQYIKDQYPGLVSVEDIPDYKELFVTPDSNGKARFVTCIYGWGCRDVNAQKIATYGLDDHVELYDPGSREGLFADLEAAYARNEPWLGYMWGPTKPALELELYRLEEPEYSDACWEADRRCAYPIAEVRILVVDSLENRAPEVVEFLRKWDFKAEAQVSTEIWLNENKKEPEEAAIWYLRNFRDVWTSFVPDDVVAKVDEALSRAD